MKKIHRFLLPSIEPGATLTINDSDVVHLIKNVLKLIPGEECIVFSDGSDDILCTISTVEKKEILLTPLRTITKLSIPKHLTVCVSITKRDTFELMVQKVTELGVETIIPIISERTVKQALRIDRLQKISDEALEQSGGSTRVHITEPLSLQQALEATKNTPSYYFDTNGATLKKHSGSTVAFFIGPEGGWSEGDLSLFATYTIPSATLGATTLRAETAAIIAAHTLLWS